MILVSDMWAELRKRHPHINLKLTSESHARSLGYKYSVSYSGDIVTPLYIFHEENRFIGTVATQYRDGYFIHNVWFTDEIDAVMFKLSQTNY